MGEQEGDCLFKNVAVPGSFRPCHDCFRAIGPRNDLIPLPIPLLLSAVWEGEVVRLPKLYGNSSSSSKPLEGEGLEQLESVIGDWGCLNAQAGDKTAMS